MNHQTQADETVAPIETADPLNCEVGAKTPQQGQPDASTAEANQIVEAFFQNENKDKYGDRLFAFICFWFRHVLDRGELWDVYMETLLTLRDQIVVRLDNRTFKAKEKLMGLARTISLNAGNNARRKKRRRERRVVLMNVYPDPTTGPESDPEALFAERELSDDIAAAIDDLDERSRQVWKECILDLRGGGSRRTFHELAEKLRMQPYAVRRCYLRGLAEIQRYLRDRGWDLPKPGT